MTIQEIEQRLDALDNEPLSKTDRKAQAVRLMAARNALIEQAQLEIWGLTREEWLTAKGESAAKHGDSLSACLNRARVKKGLSPLDSQVAKAG